MSTIAHFTKKALGSPELVQISFHIAVLEKYLAQNGTKVSRTRTVGRIKTATWSVDFGIAPDENSLHVSLSQLMQKLPESERDYWFSHADASRFSENYLKMQSSHACIDDGNLRSWGEPEAESFF